MRIGYARVSTYEQNLRLQEDALKKAGVEKIFLDKQSGKEKMLPGRRRALEMLRCGDTLCVWRLDRLGRSMGDLIQLMGELQERGISFQSLTESINTSSPSGMLIFHLFSALAEFERNRLRERTEAGLAAARARGRKGGRPLALSPKQREVAIKLYHEKQHSIAEICRIMGISKQTLYNYVKKANLRSKDS